MYKVGLSSKILLKALASKTSFAGLHTLTTASLSQPWAQDARHCAWQGWGVISWFVRWLFSLTEQPVMSNRWVLRITFLLMLQRVCTLRSAVIERSEHELQAASLLVELRVLIKHDPTQVGDQRLLQLVSSLQLGPFVQCDKRWCRHSVDFVKPLYFNLH